jgi:hypothetical protein
MTLLRVCSQLKLGLTLTREATQPGTSGMIPAEHISIAPEDELAMTRKRTAKVETGALRVQVMSIYET